jgi:hypothetical protein
MLSPNRTAISTIQSSEAKDRSDLEKIPITLVMSEAAFEQVQIAFATDRWISWPFPDYVNRLELDRAIEGDKVIHHHDGRRLETQRIMNYTFPSTYLPDDITKLIRLSYTEAVRCYENSCFLGCIALCGRIIETVLGTLYEKKTAVHPSKETSKLGINAIINRLVREGYQFPTGLKKNVEMIALHRNMAVHGNLVIPTEDEARSVVYSTRDVLKISAQ